MSGSSRIVKLLALLTVFVAACAPARIPISTGGPMLLPRTVVAATEPAPAKVVEVKPPAVSLETILRKNPRLAPALDHAASTRLQVLVSVPAQGGGWESRKSFRADAEYFYPASAIKLSVAVAALEAVTELRENGTKNLATSTVLASGARRRSGPASVATLVERALVVSDNDASNDLYDFVGFDDMHDRMWRMGLASFRMHSRIGGIKPTDDARRSPAVTLRGATTVPPRRGQTTLADNNGPGVLVGDEHYEFGRKIDGPMSFARKNRISISDLQDLLVGVVRPELRDDKAPHLGVSERAVLLSALGAMPSERKWTMFDDTEEKPLVAGVERVVPHANLTIASKSGRAYGFIVDNAYVTDKRTGRSFFLTVAMYANEDGRMNDSVYDWKRAFPILSDIGETIAESVFAAEP